MSAIPEDNYTDVEWLRAAATALDCLDTLVSQIDPDRNDGVRFVEYVDDEFADIMRRLVKKCSGDTMQQRVRAVAEQLDAGAA